MSARGVVRLGMGEPLHMLSRPTNDSPSRAACVTLDAWRRGMAFENKRPQDLADRVSRRRAARGPAPAGDAWRRESFTLPRAEAR